MKARPGVIGLMALLGCSAIAQEDSKSPAADVTTLPWLRHVSGSCWYADLNGLQDRQCFRAQFNRVVRVDQEITDPASKPAASTLHAESVYVWDPRVQKVRHVFWASDGSFESASGWAEGDALIFYLDKETDAAGRASARTVLRRTGTDTYTASREAFDGERWRLQFSFEYRRDSRPK